MILWDQAYIPLARAPCNEQEKNNITAAIVTIYVHWLEMDKKNIPQ